MLSVKVKLCTRSRGGAVTEKEGHGAGKRKIRGKRGRGHTCNHRHEMSWNVKRHEENRLFKTWTTGLWWGCWYRSQYACRCWNCLHRWCNNGGDVEAKKGKQKRHRSTCLLHTLILFFSTLARIAGRESKFKKIFDWQLLGSIFPINSRPNRGFPTKLEQDGRRQGCGRFREGCRRQGGQEEGFKSGVREGWLWVCLARVEAVKVEKRLLCAFYLFPLNTQCSLSKHVFIQLRLHASRGNERLAESAVLIVPPPRPCLFWAPPRLCHLRAPQSPCHLRTPKHIKEWRNQTPW